MISRFVRKKTRLVKRWAQRRVPLLVAVGLFVFVAVVAYTNYMQYRRLTVDPATYSSLLRLIAKAESNGNYNAYFGNASNSSILFVDMSVAEVMTWQDDFLKAGHPSSAVGRYQIINTTLAGLVRQLGIDTSRRFDQALQDELAIALLERRGAERYVNKELTRDEFAANLAKEWASLPQVIGQNPSESYYASDGLNRSRVSVDEVRRAIQPISTR